MIKMGSVVGYLRVSTKGQVRNGFSLSEQQTRIEDYCNATGLSLVKVFPDEGLSGAAVDGDDLSAEVMREGLNKMLLELPTLGAKAVVVVHTNRLWRSRFAAEIIKNKLRELGIDIISIEQKEYSIRVGRPFDILINGMSETLAEYDRVDIIERLERGRLQKASEGKYSGGSLPFGFAYREKKIIVDEEKAGMVRLIFAAKAECPEISLRALAGGLNKLGYIGARGKPINAMTVKRILDNEAFYRGKYCYGGEEYQGEHETII